jgi:regulator of cell morphogenesis and NO signaling
MITSSTTVGEIAVQLPESTRHFEQFKIDYCCGGNLPLAEACASAGVNFEQLMDMLQVATRDNRQEYTAKDFQRLPLTELIDHILETHHVFTKQELARLETLTAKVLAAHRANHPELDKVGALVDQLSADLKPHMFKEEQVLFPYIVKLSQAASGKQPTPFAPFGTVRNPVRMMMFEHDNAGGILRELREVTSDYATPQDACISYKMLYNALEEFEKDLHQHIHLENNILFPRAIELEAQLRG